MTNGGKYKVVKSTRERERERERKRERDLSVRVPNIYFQNIVHVTFTSGVVGRGGGVMPPLPKKCFWFVQVYIFKFSGQEKFN